MNPRINQYIFLSFLFILPFSFSAQSSIDFDGLDDRIDCGNNTSLQITGTEITLEAWVYPTFWKANPYEGCVINKESSSGGDNGYMLRVGDNGKINFNIGSNGWNELTTDMNTLQLNVWQHIAATYDGTSMTIYKDGTALVKQEILWSNVSKGKSTINYRDIPKSIHREINELNNKKK